MNNETLLLIDNGKHCHNAIRFEIFRGQELVASLESENHSEAKRDGERLVHAANALPECVKALEAAEYYLKGNGTVYPLPQIQSALRRAKGEK